jgi:hypothetical protein
MSSSQESPPLCVHTNPDSRAHMAKDSTSRRTTRISLRVSASERRVLADAAKWQACMVSAMVRGTVAERWLDRVTERADGRDQL